jgi:hypothetical protein
MKEFWEGTDRHQIWVGIERQLELVLAVLDGDDLFTEKVQSKSEGKQ